VKWGTHQQTKPIPENCKHEQMRQTTNNIQTQRVGCRRSIQRDSSRRHNAHPNLNSKHTRETTNQKEKRKERNFESYYRKTKHAEEGTTKRNAHTHTLTHSHTHTYLNSCSSLVRVRDVFGDHTAQQKRSGGDQRTRGITKVPHHILSVAHHT
jgi:hypothetical protein